MPMTKTIRQLFQEEKCILAPEVYDCASTMAVERCGYKAIVLSGAEVSMSMKGVPDLGILNVEEVLWITQRICDYTYLPMIVDLENGYGQALAA